MAQLEIPVYHSLIGSLVTGALQGQQQGQEELAAQQQQQAQDHARQQYQNQQLGIERDRLQFERDRATQGDLQHNRDRAANYAGGIRTLLSDPTHLSYFHNLGPDVIPSLQREHDRAMGFATGADSSPWEPRWPFGAPDGSQSQLPPANSPSSAAPLPGAGVPAPAPGPSSGGLSPAAPQPLQMPALGMAGHQLFPQAATPNLGAAAAALVPGSTPAGSPLGVPAAPIAAPGTPVAPVAAPSGSPVHDRLNTLQQAGPPVLTREPYETDKAYEARQKAATQQYFAQVRSLQQAITASAREREGTARIQLTGARQAGVEANTSLIRDKDAYLKTLPERDRQKYALQVQGAKDRQAFNAAKLQIERDRLAQQQARPGQAADMATYRGFLQAVRSKDWAVQPLDAREFWLQSGEAAAKRLGRPLPDREAIAAAHLPAGLFKSVLPKLSDVQKEALRHYEKIYTARTTDMGSSDWTFLPDQRAAADWGRRWILHHPGEGLPPAAPPAAASPAAAPGATPKPRAGLTPQRKAELRAMRGAPGTVMTPAPAKPRAAAPAHGELSITLNFSGKPKTYTKTEVWNYLGAKGVPAHDRNRMMSTWFGGR